MSSGNIDLLVARTMACKYALILLNSCDVESDAAQNQRVIHVTRSWPERSLSEVLRSVLRMLLQERKEKEKEEEEGSYYSRGIGHWQPCDVAPLTRSSVGREAPAPKWIEEQLVVAGRRANNRSELLSWSS